jgi:hypothetical protein
LYETCYRQGSVKLNRTGLVIALLCPGLSMAGEVVGTVLRGSSPAANVAVSLGQFDTRSDNSGRFLIRNVPPQTYALKCGNAEAIVVQIRDGVNQVRCQTG